jgi:hypothetical protein
LKAIGFFGYLNKDAGREVELYVTTKTYEISTEGKLLLKINIE